MRLTSFLAAAAAAFQVAQADFMVYTVPPIPTDQIPSFTNAVDASSWTFSVFVNGNRAYTSFTNALGPQYQSSRSSAASEIRAFVQSAPSNFSIPAAVTDDTTTTTFLSRPPWYTALPSQARAFKEQQVSDQFSIVRSVIAARATTASSTGAAAVPTMGAGLEGKMGVAAAVVAAVFL